MVKAIVNLGEYEDRVLTIVKGKFGLKNKSEAINFIIGKFEESFLEPELKPEHIGFEKHDSKEEFRSFKRLHHPRRKKDYIL